ncbi:MAG: HlyD family type I secretion periplasmic adaptor subunit [Gammaproteobacteria bacterium]|uniref:HlyD family type I secretion periplasmic adaptor subunit n=1 Tax=Marinomonas sp. BSi20584 TaxID=1594462 RepID=UPI000C1E0E3E|nr:HlyD family type I secretion periplasmic adaptor subunit [Marinomonas sp. BSi20584]MBU1293536.1 HlyD family type I secretion periplasmic adaptor subunit [Gammaproteobacteria bacterium]MBU1466792.1 HlyD family type I secretion periplasmic adaptor subunit [Gammaproteobacteria bacterium]MBU2020951.1 HlyD family type I secretion periplasmic adaptor subunit [Gammaproteobacteria bacterium]MBU2236901.1 HlyD family type I secretion periplasmic adaptor subunit [Gammaproteobacteria bacterium]MBU23183
MSQENKSAYESLEQVSKTQRSLLVILIAGFIGFFVWAAVSPLDVVSMANGSVEPVNKVQTIQHLEGGIVRKILVQEGQHVVKGEALVELETTNSGSSYGEMLSRVNSLTADKVRLQAEVQGTGKLVFDETFAQANPQSVKRSEALFYARRSQLNSALQAQQEEMNVRQQAIKEIATRIQFSEERLKLVKEQNAIEKELLSNALSNRYDHINSLKELNKLESDIAEGKASLAKSKASFAQAQSNLKSIQDKYNEEVNASLSDARSQLDEGTQRLKKFKDSLERTVLRAPMDGIIKNRYVVTEGGVVAPGGTVIDMVPGKDGLVVEAKLPPQDVGHIQQGQEAFIQLASGEASHYGRLMGTVASISPDTITTEEGDVYYVVRLILDQDFFIKGSNRYKLSPGVLVTAGIVTGQRSVLEYILSPFLQSLPFSLSER